MRRRPPRSTPLYSSAASDVYKRQVIYVSRITKTNNKKLIIFSAVLLAQLTALADILLILFLGFVSATKNPNHYKFPEKNLSPISFSLNPENTISILYLNKNFVGFKEALAFKESQGKYRVINTLGYLGKYQFGSTTLERFKIYNTTLFLHNPELQEQVFIAYCRVNKWILRKDIRRSVGKVSCEYS